MSGLLDNLEDSEAILLMYLADELPAADRAEVERRLSHDAALRSEFAALQALHHQLTGELDRLDAATRPLNYDGALNRLLPTMRQRQLELAGQAAAAAPAALKWPKWSLAAAAAAAIVLLGLWGLGVFNTASDRPIVVASAADPDRLVNELQRSFDTGIGQLDEADHDLHALRSLETEALSLRW